jgi:conjugal transfer/entry exclusion protein
MLIRLVRSAYPVSVLLSGLAVTKARSHVSRCYRRKTPDDKLPGIIFLKMSYVVPIMSKQNPSEPETVSSLSQALTQFIDYAGQTLRAHDVQLRSQQEQINEIRLLTRQLAESQLESFGRFEQVQSEIREIQSEIREIQSEIRGLQTENRRMIEEFIDRREPLKETEN